MPETKVRWAIAATGGIAHRFAAGLSQVADAQLVAVGSRTLESAERFGDEFSIARRYGSLDELAADSDIDVVYVASPPVAHEADAVRFLNAGRHVLVEKPFAMDETQARRMVAAASANNRFLMEAMWTRFLPSAAQLREWLDGGCIGDVTGVDANLGMRFPLATDGPLHRLHRRELGGGSLLDIGVYPVQFAHWILGAPTAIAAHGALGPTGVDNDMVAALEFAGGRTATVRSSITTQLSREATIYGTQGWIKLADPHHCTPELTLHTHATPESAAMSQTVEFSSPEPGAGIHHQVHEVHRAIRAGRLESEQMTWSESLAITHTLDAIRSDIGLTWPETNERSST